ncbi:MAG: NAD(P)-binding domain-containing protein [Verrucomicrobiota bacterium]|nr:NAD(P)-binding domain-containing protein [Verrucomicrobiota bacterium]
MIGGGPVGLAAAAHLVAAGETPIVFERGATVGSAVLEWAHVRMFSPWRYNIDEAARRLLLPTSWREPASEHLPTGRELVEEYLKPLSELPQIQPHIRLGVTVLSVSREGFDKMKSSGREKAPFTIHIRTREGTDEYIAARAVIDASGTYRFPNPAGAGGLPARGEEALSAHITYGIPDVTQRHRARYSGKRVAVIGSGHSATNALIDLVKLAAETSGPAPLWIVRRRETRALFGGGENDQLPARGRLGARLRKLVTEGKLRLVTGFIVTRFESQQGGVVIHDDMNRVSLEPVDEVIVATGFRPDLSPLRELRLDLDSTTESPSALAPLIDPNLHSCGTVYPHGAEELKHPEQDFYIVGMKSYGRAPTFLLLTGYEQVRSVVAAIRGDWDSARKVQLILPETGVCRTDTADQAETCGAGGCEVSLEVAATV